MKHQKGIHHISVLAGNPAQNHNFYVNTMGMRMVKKSVNQDDPGTYHLFYGNEAAEPGSSLTFFPWPRAHKGEPGAGEAVNVAFRVPEVSKNFWEKRLSKLNIEISELELFGKEVIRLNDPDGLELNLVFSGNPKEKVSDFESTVPHENNIQSFWGTRLKIADPDKTVPILSDIFGFKEKESSDNLTWFSTEADAAQNVFIEASDDDVGRGGRGIVHHVAFRAENEENLKEMREQVLEKGLQPTQVIDRHWFKSVYFREPNGILFEIASDDPGYAVDEEYEHLGETLILPPWLEPRRKLIENTLPALEI